MICHSAAKRPALRRRKQGFLIGIPNPFRCLQHITVQHHRALYPQMYGVKPFRGFLKTQPADAPACPCPVVLSRKIFCSCPLALALQRRTEQKLPLPRGKVAEPRSLCRQLPHRLRNQENRIALPHGGAPDCLQHNITPRQQMREG